ncbi:MAG: c-type cytochrome [Candidatus Methylacidiphilales bacterium]
MSDDPRFSEDLDYSEKNQVSRIHEQIRREASEPGQGGEPIPLWGMLFIGLVIALAFMYLGMYSGGFKGDVYDGRAAAGGSSAAGAAAAVEEDPVVLMVKVGKRIYQANCQACHMATGNGVAGLNPPLAGSEWVLENEERLVALILGGLQGPIVVKGNTYNNVMVGWKQTLNDKQIASVTTYIRQEWGNTAAPITEDTVAKVRSAHGDRSEAWTADDLIKVFGQ